MRKWGLVIGAVASVAALSVSACSSLLGDFTIGDASTPIDAANEADVTLDVGIDSPPDVASDIVVDSPVEAEAGPTCGYVGLQCCVNNACTTGACCAGTCLDLANDPKNCGACGHNCLGQNCTGFQCQAQQLGSITDARPGRVRVDGTNAYFITVNGNGNGSLYSCSKQGCTTPTAMFSGLGYGYDLVLDDNATTAYVSDSNNSKLYSCALGGCNNAPALVQVPVSGSVDGLAFRSELFAIVGVQPHEFKITGQNDVSLGNGNEGANWITAPSGSTYVYWQSTHAVRVGKDNVANSGSDFWTSSTDIVLQVESSSADVAWVGESSSTTTIYSCAVSSSCSGNNVLATGNVGYQAGALTIDEATKTVYWIGVDGSASHVFVHGCGVTGCNQSPLTLATIATNQGGAVAGGITTDASYVYFTFEDKGIVYLSRVAK